jgi:hypothetical protein
MANEIVDRAIEGMALGDIDWDSHKFRAYLVNAALAGGGSGSWTITGVTFAGTTVTITTQAAHGVVVGDRVAVKGVTGVANVDGNWVAIAGTTGTTLVLVVTSTPSGSYSGGGYVANLSKQFVSEYAAAGARVVSNRITGKTAPLGVLKCDPIIWTSVAGGPFQFIMIARTATAADTDVQADLADTSQRILVHLDTQSGLPMQLNPGNVTYTPDAATGIGKP